MPPQSFQALVALGGSLPWKGKAPHNIQQDALAEMQSLGLTVRKVSRFYTTPCFPAGAGPDYVNAAALIEAPLPPAEILTILHKVEAGFGRVRDKRWGGRTLDLDLIAVENLILPDLPQWTRWRDLPADLQQSEAPQTLILPHPRLQDRAFVLVPLMDIAPDWRHPVSGLTVVQMVQSLPQAEIDAVHPI